MTMNRGPPASRRETPYSLSMKSSSCHGWVDGRQFAGDKQQCDDYGKYDAIDGECLIGEGADELQEGDDHDISDEERHNGCGNGSAPAGEGSDCGTGVGGFGRGACVDVLHR